MLVLVNFNLKFCVVFLLILKSVTESAPIENQYKKPERGEFGPLSNRSRRTVEYSLRVFSHGPILLKF